MSVWSPITELLGAQGVMAAWGDFPAQFLTAVDGLAAAIPCDRGHPCQMHIVEHGPDDFVGVCSNEDGLCGKRQVRNKERVVFRLDEKKLFEEILQSFGGKSVIPEEISVRPRVSRIGGIPTTGDDKLPVFFALAADLSAVDAAVKALLAHGAEKFLLVVPEEKTIGIVQQNWATQHGGRIVGVDQMLEVADKGVVSARTSGLEVVLTWMEKSAPKTLRDAEGARFPTPPGTKWKDVTVTFKGRDIVEIKCGIAKAVTRERLHIPGMVDATKTEKVPTDKWFLLMAFAARGPDLSMKELERFYASNNRDMIKKQKSDLSLALRNYFGIKDPPIAYKFKGRRYHPELTIREGDNVNLEPWLEKWLEDR